LRASTSGRGQAAQHLGCSRHGGEVQRPVTLVVARVGVGTRGKQQLNGAPIAVPRRDHEGGEAVLFGLGLELRAARQ
jgi:hypothetical protein